MKSIKMTKTDTITSYLTKIRQVFDELGAAEETVGDHELVRTALNGMTKPWEVFVEGIVAWENFSKWDRLWDNFIQE